MPRLLLFMAALGLLLAAGFAAHAEDLEHIQQRGTLRHLGVPYANFVTGTGDGLDVELVKLFAEHIGVRYEAVHTTWVEGFSLLTGKSIVFDGKGAKITGSAPIKGDLMANGVTVLPWRTKILDFSKPTFPTQVWLLTRADSPLTPIRPSGDIQKDIENTRAKLKGQSVLCSVGGVCLDAAFFNLEEVGAAPVVFRGNLNDFVPAMLVGKASTTLLDAPDALIALDKFAGEIKVIGPMSRVQNMAVAFRKDSPKLRQAFNAFFETIVADGTYRQLVEKYYPLALAHFPGFFKKL